MGVIGSTMATKHAWGELVELMGSPQSEVRKGAIEVLLGLTVDNEGRETVTSQISQVISPLKKLIRDADTAVSRPALQAIINLTSDEEIAKQFDSNDIAALCVEVVQNQDKRSCVPYVAAVLSNQARFDSCCESLVREDIIEPLFSMFVEEGCVGEGPETLQYVAAFLMNLTQVLPAREYVNQHKHIVTQLIPFTRDPNLIRRQGAIGTIRNFTLVDEAHPWLLDELQILPHIVYPLVGPEPMPDDDKEGMCEETAGLIGQKPRETDVVVRRLVLEALTCLCLTQHGREVLYNGKTYPILRNSDKEEEDDRNRELAFELVNILILNCEGPVDLVPAHTNTAIRS
eukprot:c8492_g1_i1.p1 GENE.c8492_g1_i1~~c8492_g1_i1.p1  ORF type:complete len:344 (-),score=74.67 c8492_g1_i1:299-1330(-)